jgi:hypothetical protein
MKRGYRRTYMTTDSCIQILHISSFLRCWAKETDNPETGLVKTNGLEANATQTTAKITAKRSITVTTQLHKLMVLARWKSAHAAPESAGVPTINLHVHVGLTCSKVVRDSDVGERNALRAARGGRSGCGLPQPPQVCPF